MLLTINSTTFPDSQDIFPECFYNPTTYKFTEKKPAAEHFNVV